MTSPADAPSDRPTSKPGRLGSDRLGSGGDDGSSWPGSPINRFANAAEVVADILRRGIYEGRLAPGERLRETEIAARIGVSRTPVREALLILQTEGLVSAEPNRGSTVRSYSMAELVDFIQIRGMLQAYAAAQAAARITPEQLAQLHDCCDVLEGLVDSAEVVPVVEATLRFHEIVVSAAGSRMLTDLIRSAAGMPLMYRVFTWDTPETRRNTLRHLRKITEAMERRDAVQAENVTRVLALDVRDVLLSQPEAASMHTASPDVAEPATVRPAVEPTRAAHPH
jgi:DNA-binding GntR family transcriptional regulator